jgi:hypothetical protein
MAAIMGAMIRVVGGYLAYIHRRLIKLHVAEKRFAPYMALWTRVEPSTPLRLTECRSEPASREERENLFNEFTAWYYENGNGMFLGDRTRAVYLKAKDNLIRDLKYYRPFSLKAKLRELPDDNSRERARGYLSIRQLSLLRNRMKADLDVYGLPYHVDLDDDDRAFLEYCGEKLHAKPWNKREALADDQSVKIFPC